MGWVQFASPDHVHFGKGAFWGNVVWRHKNKTQTLKLERKKCKKHNLLCKGSLGWKAPRTPLTLKTPFKGNLVKNGEEVKTFLFESQRQIWGSFVKTQRPFTTTKALRWPRQLAAGNPNPWALNGEIHDSYICINVDYMWLHAILCIKSVNFQLPCLGSGGLNCWDTI